MTLSQDEFLVKLQSREERNSTQASILISYSMKKVLISLRKESNRGCLCITLMTPLLMTTQTKDGLRKKLMKMAINVVSLEKL